MGHVRSLMVGIAALACAVPLQAQDADVAPAPVVSSLIVPTTS